MKNISERAANMKLLREFHMIEPPTPNDLLETFQFGEINVITSHFGLPALVTGICIYNGNPEPIQIANVDLEASWTSTRFEIVNPNNYEETPYPFDLEEKYFINKRLFSPRPLARRRKVEGLLYARILDKFPNSRKSPVNVSLTIETVDGQVCRSQLELEWLVELPRTPRKERVPLFGTTCPPAPTQQYDSVLECQEQINQLNAVGLEETWKRLLGGATIDNHRDRH